jgi:hypothetical protein
LNVSSTSCESEFRARHQADRRGDPGPDRGLAAAALGRLPRLRRGLPGARPGRHRRARPPPGLAAEGGAVAAKRVWTSPACSTPVGGWAGIRLIATNTAWTWAAAGRWRVGRRPAALAQGQHRVHPRRGSGTNVVPGKCDLHCRILPGDTPEGADGGTPGRLNRVGHASVMVRG